LRLTDDNGRLFGPETHAELPRPRSLSALIGALREPALRPAILFVEGIQMSHEVEAELAEKAVERVATGLSGTIWPKSRQLHVQLDDDVIDALERFSHRLAEPEVCDHLVVYRAGVALLVAYDAGQDPVWVTRLLPSEVHERLARALDGG
jgi:hypothetical protein